MNTVGSWHKNKDYIILLAKTNMLLSPNEKDKRFGKLLFPPARDKHSNISSKKEKDLNLFNTLFKVEKLKIIFFFLEKKNFLCERQNDDYSLRQYQVYLRMVIIDS